MGKTKANLRSGLWPDAKEPASHHVGLTLARAAPSGGFIKEGQGQ